MSFRLGVVTTKLFAANVVPNVTVFTLFTTSKIKTYHFTLDGATLFQSVVVSSSF